jgi:hypothetical protein
MYIDGGTINLFETKRNRPVGEGGGAEVIGEEKTDKGVVRV